MIELIIGAPDIKIVRDVVLGQPTEGCAVMMATEVARSDGTIRLLIRGFIIPEVSDYAYRSELGVELVPAFIAKVTKQALKNAEALVFIHSHPGEKTPQFSLIDDAGEAHLGAFLAHRLPTVHHVSLVISEGGVCARRLGSSELIRVIVLGENREVLFDPSEKNPDISSVFDRQVRAFGMSAQITLENLHVAIVGLGGTGSLVSQQLAHLGVRNFTLIDPDILEESNLNRVVNTGPEDVGHSKVEIAARYIHKTAKDAIVTPIIGDIMRVKIARELLNADMIFGCTDSHGSRAILQQVAYQYMIPCIDMGSVIVATSDKATHVFGRVQMLAPGLACFTCNGLLNSSEVRKDMMTAFERQADPYILGMHNPAPAVISLNGMVASLAVSMLLSAIGGLPSRSRHIMYNSIRSELRTLQTHPDDKCYICSRSGAYARGDTWPIFGRND